MDMNPGLHFVRVETCVPPALNALATRVVSLSSSF